jgi:hypothetical protein
MAAVDSFAAAASTPHRQYVRPGSDNGQGTVDCDGLILDGWRLLPLPA